MHLTGLAIFRDSASIFSKSFSENTPVSHWLPAASEQVKTKPQPVVPLSDSHALIFLRREDTVYIVACVSRECSALLVIEILDKLFRAISSELTQETAKTNLPALHATLDNILPYGVYTDLIDQKRESSNFFGQAEIYVDVTERWELVADANATTGASAITTMSVAGSLDVAAKTPEKSEIFMTVNAGPEISRFGFHACVRRGKFLETQRRTISCILPNSSKFLLAEYAVVGELAKFPALPFSLNGFFILDAAGGKLDLEIFPRNTAAGSSATTGPQLEKVEVEIQLPEISTGGSLVSSASVRLEKDRIIWRVGSLTQKIRLEGSVVGNFAAHTAWRPVAQVRFLAKAWNVSGLRVESLDVACPGNVKPYKGVRYNTVGNCELRF
jgi:hypothetical protein